MALPAEQAELERTPDAARGGIGSDLLPKRIPWAQHSAWLDRHWHAGEHLSVIAPTGGGKSYLIRHGLLPLWVDYRVLVIDVKGDDKTLAELGIPVYSFPEQEAADQAPPAEEEGPRIYRLLVPGFEWSPTMKRDSEGVQRARNIVGEAFDEIYRQGRWLLVIDETTAVTDSVQAFGLGLRGLTENLWRRGRSREVTVVAVTQAPRYVPSSFYDQASLIYLGRSMDERGRDRLGEIGGDTRTIERTLPTLRGRRGGGPDYLVVERDTGRMAIVKVGS